MDNNKNPLVSIVATSYNFEKFIPYFMESVLAQTYKNWELIVTDDCSADKSLEILKSYENEDKRIRIFQNDRNRHAYYTMNNSIKNATGDYICMISCDDAFFPEKIAHDVEFMENNSNIGVLYGQLSQIDEKNISHGKYSYVPLENFDRFNLLREMYLSGNKCLAPGMFLRREIAELAGNFSMLRVTHDYEYHIKVLFHTEPAYNAKPLTQYRRMSNNSNLSSDNVSSTINSEDNETFFILNVYLKYITEYSLLRRIFPEVVKFGPNDDRLVPFYLGRLALTSKLNHVKAFGLHIIYTFISNQDNADYLEKRANFLPKDFMKIASDCRIYRPSDSNDGCLKKIGKFLYGLIKIVYRKLKKVI